jgi:AraC-like DNA-binding protein
MPQPLHWQTDPLRSRIFWLHHEHFDLGAEYSAGLSQISFELRACYDVVAAPGWCIASPRQPWSEIWLLRDGQVDISQDEKRATIRAGEVALLTAGRSRLTVESRNAPFSLIGFSFDALLWNSIDLFALLELPIVLIPSTPAREKLEAYLKNLIAEFRAPQAMSTLAARSWAQLAFAEVLRIAFPGNELEEIWRAKMPAALSPDIASTLSFIAEHLATPLNVELLARQAHLSPKHFSRKFKAAMKLTPMEYVRSVRLQRAQGLLAASDEAIGQIAARCGFEDAAHFSRAFKEYSASSPLEFRRHARAFSAKTPHDNPND